MNWWGLLVVAFGLLWLGGAVYNWEWFWTRGRQGFGAELFGRNPARILYGILGLAAVILGVLSTIGLFPR
jgi:hypothetical protein